MAPAGLNGSKAKNADVSKNNINILSLYTVNIKKGTDILNWNILFLLQTTYLHESLERLNSSLTQCDGELLPGWNAPQSGFWGSKILVNFCFLSHNFSSGYARKLIKGSKESYSSQDSNKALSPKNVPLGRRPVATGGIRGQCSPQFFVPPQMIQTQKFNQLCKCLFSICLIVRFRKNETTAVANEDIVSESSTKTRRLHV